MNPRITAALAILLCLAFTTCQLRVSAARARHSWEWFVRNIRPGDKCSGPPIATTMYGDGPCNADGSHFNPAGRSVASWDYPFGTVLRITNCSNGRSANVVVKDRGPARRQRRLGIKLDLSVGAARAIALGQHGRFESGWTSVSVVSIGNGRRAGTCGRHRK